LIHPTRGTVTGRFLGYMTRMGNDTFIQPSDSFFYVDLDRVFGELQAFGPFGGGNTLVRFNTTLPLPPSFPAQCFGTECSSATTSYSFTACDRALIDP
jgi:hypothetical protein